MGGAMGGAMGGGHNIMPLRASDPNLSGTPAGHVGGGGVGGVMGGRQHPQTAAIYSSQAPLR